MAKNKKTFKNPPTKYYSVDKTRKTKRKFK